MDVLKFMPNYDDPSCFGIQENALVMLGDVYDTQSGVPEIGGGNYANIDECNDIVEEAFDSIAEKLLNVKIDDFD